MMRVNLHQAERKLIELIRAMKNGEISCIKVQNGLPVFYIIDLKDKKLI
jgi:antitoxin (DNA-binding transcriptional repressor) of toxin-antitoxin stability system